MKLTKENIYVSLIGKTKEELTDLWEFLDKAVEKQYLSLNRLLNAHEGWNFFIFGRYNQWTLSITKGDRKEVTIEQLKQIIKPMFTPIAMKCTQEQFKAIKPKLEGFTIGSLENFNDVPYLINNRFNIRNNITNYRCPDSEDFNICEEWNEEIFLKACGIEVDSLEQQLQKAEAEVKRLQSLIEEENKPKVGDFVKNEYGFIYKLECDLYTANLKKITNPELIKLLEQEIK